jgi:hypothetical protein
MNVLLVINSETYSKHNRFALIPDENLKDENGDPINLDMVNNQEVQDPNIPDHIKNTMLMLFERLGLEPRSSETVRTEDTDLAEFLDPEPPFNVDKIVTINWAQG